MENFPDIIQKLDSFMRTSMIIVTEQSDIVTTES